MRLLFREIYRSGLEREGNVALSKHVTHYCLRSSFANDNLNPSIERAPLIRHPVTHLAVLCVSGLGTVTSTQNKI